MGCAILKGVQMNEDNNTSIEEALAALLRLEEHQLELWQRMLRAYGSALYPLDLLATGASNRSAALCSGFRSLIKGRNIICAAPLLRLQIDTALRFYAAFLVDEPHGFASAVLKGIPVRKLKDKTGKLMHDSYLISCLSKQYPWVAKVYETTSGYIHLSATHISLAIESTDEQTEDFEMQVGAGDKELPERTYVEAIEAFCAVTRVLHYYVEGWTVTKNNPEMAARFRKNMVNTRD